MKTKLKMFITLFILLALTACGNNQQAVSPESLTPTTTNHPQTSNAVYSPDRFTDEIPQGEWLWPVVEYGAQIPKHWTLTRTYQMPHSDAQIVFYSNPNAPSEVQGYLKGSAGLSELGVYSSSDADRIQITPLDYVKGKSSGVTIDRPKGYPSIYEVPILLTYNNGSGIWRIIDFEGHRAEPMDLDGDGVPEWVGNHTDWVPPMVEITYWVPEKDNFIRTVVQLNSNNYKDHTDQLPSYSLLLEDKGKSIMQLGNEKVYSFVAFDHGVLKKYHPKDTRNRMYEEQK
ncbi:hypothetical protein NV379_17555 [Paenibacillus sp. N1-5-1-14]|uniref:hypothetical protein n=1 Tax=Paenibacillus radicibacter TaxID=2972488 RepID=UPI0021591E1A|nr:hypothetical protein [Paenibacillus radicibacter]MCR8644464.1 hypothetical protein [Paenibacillus radicibacter]